MRTVCTQSDVDACEGETRLSAAGATCDTVSPVVNYLSQSIIINSINSSLLHVETRCQHAMTHAARRHRRLISELAMRCPPLTVYGPASVASCPPDDVQTVWNHTRTRPFNAVDAISRSEAARLSDKHITLIGENTAGSRPAGKLMSMLRRTATEYMHRELDQLVSDLVPALFDLLAARQGTTLPLIGPPQ